MGAGARDPVPVAVFAAPEKYGTWNPGLESELPHDYLPLSSMFRAFRTEDVSTSIAKAYELSEFCGLPAEELVAFR